MTLEDKLKKVKKDLKRAERDYPQGKIDQPKLDRISSLRTQCDQLVAQIKKERRDDNSLSYW